MIIFVLLCVTVCSYSYPKVGPVEQFYHVFVYDFINCLTGSVYKFNGELKTNVFICTHVFILLASKKDNDL